MENRAHALSAGLFLILLCIGLVLAALRLTGDTAERTGYVIESKFPVSGLQQNAPVRLRGVDVGKVGAIHFAADDPRLILIDIAVDPEAPLTKGTYAQLNYLGITGLSYIQLDDDGSQPGRLASRPDRPAHISMRPSLLDQATSSGKDLMQDAAETAKRINALLSDANINELSATMQNVRLASANLVRLTDDLQPAVKAVTSLAARAEKPLRQLDPLLVSLTRLSEDVRMRVDALDRIGQSAEDLGQASRAMNDTIPRLDVVLNDFSRSMRTVDRVLRGIDEQPQSLLFGRGPVPPGPGELGFIAPQQGP